MKKWYEKLFDNYGKQYDKESFAQGTIGECDFIEKELNYDKSLKIIDIGCGTGRHSIELTKRGYSVTGIDLSESQLKKAREKAEEALERPVKLELGMENWDYSMMEDSAAADWGWF